MELDLKSFPPLVALAQAGRVFDPIRWGALALSGSESSHRLRPVSTALSRLGT
jgi:hypothetical protein